MSEVLLRVKGLETAYGQSQVLFGLDLEIRAGEVVTLLGRNGMGKTTTVRSIMGLTPARGGSIEFRGQRIERQAPDRIARAGIALVTGARVVAAFAGRSYVVPDDVTELVLAALRHRVILSPEAEVAGNSVDGALEALMRTIEVPRL